MPTDLPRNVPGFGESARVHLGVPVFHVARQRRERARQDFRVQQGAGGCRKTYREKTFQSVPIFVAAAGILAG